MSADSSPGRQRRLPDADRYGQRHHQNVFWVYRDGRYQAATTLNIGEGGWIKKLTAGEGYLFFPETQAIDADAEAAGRSYRRASNSRRLPPPIWTPAHRPGREEAEAAS
jgi:hypothetical protein